MTFKKLLLLASMALAAIAFAVPASASASELYDVVTEKAPAENSEFETTGMASFELLGSGYTCLMDVIWMATSPTHIEMTGIVFTNCDGFGSTYKNCKVKSASTIPSEMPSFPVVVEEESLNVEGTKVVFVGENNEKSECKAKKTTFSFPSVIAQVNSPSGIETLTLSGKGTAESELGTNEAKMSGTLTVAGTNSGTYGIK